MTTLRVVVATPLSEDLCALLSSLEPRLDIVHDAALLPPQRHAGDHRGDPSFKRTLDQQQRFNDLIDSADALYGIPDESPDALRRTVGANSALRWVHTMAAGGGGQIRAARLDDADLHRVLFTTSAGVHAEPLSEFVVFGVLAGAKRLPRLLVDQRHHTWPAERYAMGHVSEQTVVIVGLGSIGRRAAEKLAALGARVLAVHRRHIDVPGVERIVPVEQFADIVEEADAVVLTLPDTGLTRKMLNASIFARMTPGTTVVNVGRGSTVDQPALIEALDDGTVGFAALDVFEPEPLDRASPLWTHPRALVSPHVAALSSAEDRRIVELFASNANRLIDGRALHNSLNTREFY